MPSLYFSLLRFTVLSSDPFSLYFVTPVSTDSMTLTSVLPMSSVHSNMLPRVRSGRMVLACSTCCASALVVMIMLRSSTLSRHEPECWVKVSRHSLYSSLLRFTLLCHTCERHEPEIEPRKHA